MHSKSGRFRTGLVFSFVTALLTGCATAPAPPPAESPAASRKDPATLAAESAMAAASDAFALGREAALSGDFVCARFYFERAVDAAKPPRGPAVASGTLVAFSIDLYDGIQRYEALSGAAEEAGTSHGDVAPELAEIESPQASPEELATAREAVDSDVPSEASDIPVVVNDAVLRVLAAFQSEALREKIAAGLERSGRYVPMIHRVFEEEGLPKDLAMIAMIESSFLPHARSPKQAHGIWQFMPRTGRQYGLKANGLVDERSDPEKATRAAARYLNYLHELFNDWYLAMAAYNAGEGKVMRALQRTGARDFWQLASTNAIRKQTQNYVPAFLAAVLISKNPSHYGFELDLEPPLEYETVVLDRPVSLEHLAAGAQIPIEDLQRLNPELRLTVTPHQPEGYELKVPSGLAGPVQTAFARCPTTRPPAFKTHVARKGETLPRIARRYGVSVAALASANSLSTRARVARGQEIMVPEKVAKARAPKKGKAASAQKVAGKSSGKAKAAEGARSYKVKSGDTLYRIALRHGTTVAEILAINGLGGVHIRPGDRLKLPKK